MLYDFTTALRNMSVVIIGQCFVVIIIDIKTVCKHFKVMLVKKVKLFAVIKVIFYGTLSHPNPVV